MPVSFAGFNYNDPMGAPGGKKYRISRNGQTWTEPVKPLGEAIAVPGWDQVKRVHFQLGTDPVQAPFFAQAAGFIECVDVMQSATLDLDSSQTPAAFESFNISDPNASGHYYQVAKNSDPFDSAQLPVGTPYLTAGWGDEVTSVRYQVKDASNLIVAQGHITGFGNLKSVHVNVTP